MRKLMSVLLLAGCGALGQPVPQVARLSSKVLTVTLSDGTVCHADWQAAGGTGRLDPCAPGYRYRVTEVTNPNPLRQVFLELTTALGANTYVPPMAEVVITDAAGRAYVFVSPPPADLSD